MQWLDLMPPLLVSKCSSIKVGCTQVGFLWVNLRDKVTPGVSNTFPDFTRDTDVSSYRAAVTRTYQAVLVCCLQTSLMSETAPNLQFTYGIVSSCDELRRIKTFSYLSRKSWSVNLFWLYIFKTYSVEFFGREFPSNKADLALSCRNTKADIWVLPTFSFKNSNFKRLSVSGNEIQQVTNSTLNSSRRKAITPQTSDAFFNPCESEGQQRLVTVQIEEDRLEDFLLVSLLTECQYSFLL